MGMADNYRDTITKDGIKLRFDMLMGYTIEQIEAAALRIMRSRKFLKMPTIADFIEAIEGSATDVAEIQAHHVLCQVRECGAYRTPSFDDPVARELVARRWTWAALCSMPIKDHQWFVKEFVHAYRAYERLEVVPQLEGPASVKQLSDGLFEKVAGPP